MPYLSSSSFDKKTEVLEKLLKNPNVIPNKKLWKERNEQPLYYILTYKKGFLMNYLVKILYNETGYYINSIIGFGQSSAFSSDNVNEIIGKIKTIEAEL